MARCLAAFTSLAACVTAQSMPLPFTRELQASTPSMNGTDVFILQNLLLRSPGGANLPISSAYDAPTVAAVTAFQLSVGLAGDGVFGPLTASATLLHLAVDPYVDNGTTPGALGLKYKVLINAHVNRSVEVDAVLTCGLDPTPIFTWRVRAHGVDVDDLNPPWPHWNSCCDGLNDLSSDGNTPSGLILSDLNSPEDDPLVYGPWPVLRAVQGVAGNAAWTLPGIRDGILMHTGGWSNVSNWTPQDPMPNSEGCVHSHPEDHQTLISVLMDTCGVQVRPNTGGKLPYPYPPQGLISLVVHP